MDLQEIIIKAWSDEAFKQELLRDPKSIIEHELEIHLPAEIEIFVHEQTPTRLHLILPMKPEFDE
jgi:hypothetical protein